MRAIGNHSGIGGAASGTPDTEPSGVSGRADRASGMLAAVADETERLRLAGIDDSLRLISVEPKLRQRGQRKQKRKEAQVAMGQDVRKLRLTGIAGQM